MAKKYNNIEEQLRQAILDSDMSRYQIWQETVRLEKKRATNQNDRGNAKGVTQAQLSLFLSGKRGISIETAIKTAEVLGLELVLKKKG